MKQIRKYHGGFTLLELSIVLVVVSLLVAGMLSVSAQRTRAQKMAEVERRLDAIETALLSFRKNYWRLPCPADLTLTMADASGLFGMESIPPGDCTNGDGYTSGFRTTSTPPSANGYTGNTVMGGIPVRDLGLPDDYAFDPWGGRFVYAVDVRITRTNALASPMPVPGNMPSSVGYSSSNRGIGSMTIQDHDGTTLSASAAVVLLSHGQNGHGAFQSSGIRKNTGSNDPYERVNCHCNSIAAPTTFTELFISNIATGVQGLTSYDDITRHYRRANFLNANEELIEK